MSDSIQKEWYENGQIKTVSSYKNGVFDGEYKEWYEDGSPKEVGFYNNGKPKGTSKKWYNNGQLKDKGYYIDSYSPRSSTSWFENGKKSSETKVKNGISKNIVWHENGQMMFKFYTDEKFNKLKVAKAWYENGQPLKEIKYENYKAVEKQCWDENGNVIECPEYGFPF